MTLYFIAIRRELNPWVNKVLNTWHILPVMHAKTNGDSITNYYIMPEHIF